MGEGGGYKYKIYIINHDITDEHKYMLNKINYKDNISINYVDFDISYFLADRLDISHRPQFSKDIMTRLFLHKILPDLDRVLYLDADIIITFDIAELFNIDIGQFPIAAYGGINRSVEEEVDRLKNLPIGKDFPQYCNHYEYRTMHLGLSDQELLTYFSSGFILFNLNDAGKIIDKRIDALLVKKFSLPDQDILNIIFKNNVFLLGQKYCIVPEKVFDFYNTHGVMPNIIHYAGPRKPNNHTIKNLGGVEYWKAVRNTDFFYLASEEFINSQIYKAKNEINARLDKRLQGTIKIEDIYYDLKRLDSKKRRQKIIRFFIKILVNKKRYNKLKRSPVGFFNDSKSSFIRFLGKYYN